MEVGVEGVEGVAGAETELIFVGVDGVGWGEGALEIFTGVMGVCTVAGVFTCADGFCTGVVEMCTGEVMEIE